MTNVRRVMFQGFRGLIGYIAISFFAATPLLHGATLPAGFTEVQVANGLASATAMAFFTRRPAFCLPSGRTTARHQ